MTHLPRGGDRRSFPWLLLAAVTLLSGACGGGSGCGGCNEVQPLPAGGLPADQTVEAGAQIRVTPSGMAKVQDLARGVVEGVLGNGVCIPPTNLGNVLASASLCQSNQGQCTPGCDVDLTIDSITISPTDPQTLRFSVQVDAVAQVPVSFRVVGVPGSCTVTAVASNVVLTADLAAGLDAGNGELQLRVAQVVRPNINVTFSNCGLGSEILNLLRGFLSGYIADAIVAIVRPALENLLRDLLPDPLGLVGVVDVGGLLSGFSSGSTGSIEARLVPGGHVHFTPADGGLSLGMITGINADRDPSTRTPALDSEPARCVPPLPAPDFTTAPHSLPRTPRSTFILPTSPAFDGAPDPANADLAFGLSETTFDLLGHHLVTSGAACLSVGTAQVSRLTLGTFGIISPSLAALGSEARNDPMLLVTRPTSAVDFAIGDGTATSPSVTMKLKDFDIDVYAFLYERYTRAFTMSLSLDVGLNLEFEQPPGEPVSIKPILIGVSSSNVRIQVANSEFVRETKDSLETVLPAIFDLVTPLLGDLPSFALPSFAGFSLENLSVRKVTTAEDSFLAVAGTLGASTLPIAATRPSLASAAASPPPRVVATARLAGVEVPALDDVRRALRGEAETLPKITLDVDRVDAQGRELEWSWRLDHGLWRPYSGAAPLVLQDRSFAFQGDVTIGLMARAKGDYRTVSEELRVPVRLDSVPPHLVQEETSWQDGGLTVVGFDVVAGRDVEVAFGAPGADRPATAWQPGGRGALDAAGLGALARGGEVVVFLRDPSGNTDAVLVTPFHGQVGAGCGCSGGGEPRGGALLLALVVLGAARGRRRGEAARGSRPVPAQGGARRGGARGAWRMLGVGALILGGSALVPGCSCGSHASRACEVVQDCAGFCGAGDVAFCIEGTCVCTDDIEPGRIGPYTDLAVSERGVAWVVAYAQNHGDLVAVQAKAGRIAPESWEWVDGVPDGPVAVENAKIRGGIAAEGPDIGMYPSVAVTSRDEPRISYFDRDSASLRYAAKVDGVWQKHVVDAGTGALDGAAGSLVGMYTSLTLRADDGRPGIAYLAHVKDEAGVHAEVRYASAQVPDPKVAADWLIKVVDTAPLPMLTPDMPNLYPLPAGLGLFIDSARLQNQAPVVVYYDRGAGQLKLSAFNPTQDRFDPAVVLDGGGGNDAGWSPTIAVDSVGKVHVAYVGATHDDLEYIKVDTGSSSPEIVDDGYRIVGDTAGGLPKPEYHFVGDDASLLITLNGQPVIAYQDATSHELLLARRDGAGVWSRTTVAGDEVPFAGAYGFFAAAAATSSKLYLANWVLDPAADDQWVEVFERGLTE